jgi:hypothetical protein
VRRRPCFPDFALVSPTLRPTAKPVGLFVGGESGLRH